MSETYSTHLPFSSIIALKIAPNGLIKFSFTMYSNEFEQSLKSLLYELTKFELKKLNCVDDEITQFLVMI